MSVSTPPSVVRVAIVDDDPEFRRLLSAFLATTLDLVNVGETATGDDIVDFCRQVGPEVVLMDVQMPGVGGVAATAALTADCPQIGVLALTVMADLATVVAMLRAGARGYLLKDTTPSILADHIRSVAEGGGALSPAVARALIADVTARPDRDAAGRPTLPPPSVAEQEVLDGLARGLTNVEMAREGYVSTSAIKARLVSLSRKWEVSGRTRLLMTAVAEGWVAQAGSVQSR